MKLTKQKLEQLIMEEMRYFRPPEFDPRAEKEYPQHADKLSNIYGSNPAQGRSLSHGLNDGEYTEDGDPIYEPIDVKVPKTNEDSEQHLSYGIQQFRQESTATYHGFHGGNIEIYFHTQEKKWFVNYFLLDTYKGKSSFVFNPKLSREFSNAEEAIAYYNNHADKKIT